MADTEWAGPTSSGPLHGVRVLEVTGSIAGETAGVMLADLGADVIRIAVTDAPPLGSRELAAWYVRNRGKKLARADALDGLGRKVHGLIGRADVLLVDLTASRLAAAGLDADAVAARSPGCIHAWLPPMAPHGPVSELPHDPLLLEALGGSASYFPAHEDRPVAAVSALASVLHGVLGATHATIELVGRARTGQVGPVVVGGLRAQALANHLLMIEGVDGPLVYSGNKRIEGNAHYRFYEAADGGWLFLAALGDVLFIEALAVLGRLDVLARRDVAGDFSRILLPEVTREVGRELQATFRTRTADEWLTRFEAADVPLARVRDRKGWLASDVVAFACPPSRVSHEDVGELVMPGVPIGFSTTPASAGVVPRTSDPGDVTSVLDAWDHLADHGNPPPRPRTEGPLAGCRVVEMALYVAAPVIGSLLAGAGAEIVKVEPPHGDPYRSYAAAFATLNHAKTEMSLDVGLAEDRGRLLDMAASADVLIDNLRPDSLERLGLTPDVIETTAPRIVRASVTAFGQSGPWVASPGFDPILQTMSGLAGAQGGDTRPVASTNPLHDVTTGALGALGVAASLFDRERTGGGQRVFVSLAATSTLLQSGELATYPGCPPPLIGGRDHPGPSPWHRFYRVADGWIAVRALDDDEQSGLVEVLGKNPDDTAPEEVANLFAKATLRDWLARFAEVGVPAAPVLERGDFEAPFLEGADFTTEIEAGELGRLRVLNPFAH